MKVFLLPARPLFILFLVSFILAGACSSSKLSAHHHDKNIIAKRFSDFQFYAWNEDSSRIFQFSVFRKDVFQYAITKKEVNGSPLTRFYDGHIHWSADTLYLDYKKDGPPGLVPYLIHSGEYYVQQSAAKNKLYLRIEQRHR